MARPKAKYNPEADKKWNEENKKHRQYLGARSSAKSFIRNKATMEDLAALEELIATRKEFLKENPIVGNPWDV